MLAKLQVAFVFNPILSAGLARALGTAAGIIQTIGLVAVLGGLIGAAASALSERHLSGVKTSWSLRRSKTRMADRDFLFADSRGGLRAAGNC